VGLSSTSRSSWRIQPDGSVVSSTEPGGRLATCPIVASGEASIGRDGFGELAHAPTSIRAAASQIAPRHLMAASLPDHGTLNFEPA
jgi:hypothetical protein